MIWLYNLFLTLLSPFWIPWLVLRANRRGEKVNWKERLGDYQLKLKKGSPRLWLHAVSVGEVVAALPVLRQVRRMAPDLEVVLSVTTSSGHRTAREQAQDLVDHLVYYPIDVYRFALGALVRVRPTVVAVMETELWMNFLDGAKNLGAATLLVNGRLSDRSFPRARAFGFFYRGLLRRVDRCLVQTERDAERFRALGAQEVEVLGNCKFDQAVEGLDADPDRWRADLGLLVGLPVIVVGSTRSESEERLVGEALKRLEVQVVWAPRHLERAEPLAEWLVGQGFAVGRRSQGDKMASPAASPVTVSGPDQGGGRLETPVLLLDTYGELSQVYSVADLVVIGGGFDDLGGQNLIQPLAHGKPVIHGPHMQNFRDATEAADQAGAALQVQPTAEALSRALLGLLGDDEERGRRGQAARAWVAANLGAASRYAEAIVSAAQAQRQP